MAGRTMQQRDRWYAAGRRYDIGKKRGVFVAVNVRRDAKRHDAEPRPVPSIRGRCDGDLGAAGSVRAICHQVEVQRSDIRDAWVLAAITAGVLAKLVSGFGLERKAVAFERHLILRPYCAATADARNIVRPNQTRIQCKRSVAQTRRRGIDDPTAFDLGAVGLEHNS